VIGGRQDVRKVCADLVSLAGRAAFHSSTHRGLVHLETSELDCTEKWGRFRLTRKTVGDLEAVNLAEWHAGVLCLTAGEPSG
jgi:hypothetical protein